MKDREINRTINGFSYLSWLCLFASMMIATAGNAQHEPGNVMLQFHHVVDKNVLQLDSTYQNSFGEQFTVTKFKYYISNIEFSDTIRNTQHSLKDTYFLVNEASPESKLISLKIPLGRYQKISFLLGVDSAKNVTGAQTGALDPLNDMFWTWRSGYVMAKLEGRSPASALQRRMIEYHIGGFSGTNNVLGRVSLILPQAIEATQGRNWQIHLQADLDAWFNGVHELSIKQYPACTSIGVLAKQFSDNYLQMISIQSIQAR